MLILDIDKLNRLIKLDYNEILKKQNEIILDKISKDTTDQFDKWQEMSYKERLRDSVFGKPSIYITYCKE